MISLKFSAGGITTDNSFRSSPEHSKQVLTYLLALDCSCWKLSMSVRVTDARLLEVAGLRVFGGSFWEEV
jgi:hypothetical protein